MPTLGTVLTEAGAPDSDAVELHNAGAAPATSDRIPRAWMFSHRGMAGDVLADLSDLGPLANGDVRWVDLTAPSARDMGDAAQTLALEPAAVRAAAAPWQRPTVAAFADQAWVNASVLTVDLESLTVLAQEFDCFLGQNFVLTMHAEPLPFLDEICTRAETNAEAIHTDPAYLLYILLDELIDDFAAVADALDDMIEELEVAALTANDQDFLDRLVRRKRFVYGVNRLVGQHAFLFHGLLRPDFPLVSGESVEGYFAELNERFVNVAGRFTDARQEMLGTFDIYMTSVAHRTNGIVKTLTMISILVLPATAIFGFFGTNFVQLPFFGTVGFVVMVVLLGLLTVAQLVIFRARGWVS